MKRLVPVFAAVLGLGAVGAAVLLVSTRRMVVEGRSMEPGFSAGDRVLVNKLAYVRAAPQRGDVVVLHRPGQAPHIKRIAGVPGDEAGEGDSRRVLAADEWWVLGDNEAESTDSRQIGPVSRKDVAGKVMLKY
jgi:signal peptidase I